MIRRIAPGPRPHERSALPLAPRRFPAALTAAFAVALLAAACSASDDDDDADAFVVRSTNLAIANGNSPLAASGYWLAFIVSEAGQGPGGTDFNGDGDLNDGIAARVDTNAGTTQVLDVAVTDLAFARRTLFMVVDEMGDSVDWNGDLDMNDRVLLYQTPTASQPTYLDDLDATSPIVAIGGTVVYASATAPTALNETNLRTVTVTTNGAAPTAPAMVLAGSDPNNDGITYEIRGSDGDVVFLDADEMLDGDLNGDGDADDTSIFAVLDAGAQSPQAFLTGIAIGPSSRATAVPISGGGEWLVAFLADESQEGVSLNDPSDFSPTWLPQDCAAPDIDTNDFVLHWFQFTDLAMSTAPVNTGLVGAFDGRALALRSGYVGVVSPEDQQGSNCDLNGDGDALDPIFRWVEAQNPAAPPLPVTTQSRLIAVDTSIPGGAEGIVRLTNTWVIIVDEAADGRSYDTDPATDRSIVLALNPSNTGALWNAQHSGSAAIPVGVSWMSEDAENPLQFLAALQEEVRTIFGQGDLNGDGDAVDSVPTVASQSAPGSANIAFPGIAVAAEADNAGLTVEQNVGYFRVSEAAQGNVDLNGDGDTNDVLLMRFSLTGAFPLTLMGSSNTFNRPAVEFGPGVAQFGACITEESQGGVDLNGDGDTADAVVRYFRLP